MRDREKLMLATRQLSESETLIVRAYLWGSVGGAVCAVIFLVGMMLWR